MQGMSAVAELQASPLIIPHHSLFWPFTDEFERMSCYAGKGCVQGEAVIVIDAALVEPLAS